VSYLLDTDVCSAYLKGNRSVWNKCIQYGGRIHVSAINVAELYVWALRRNASPRRLIDLTEFLEDVTILNPDAEVARRYGEIRASELDRGLSTPEMDLLIAATALVNDLTLVTHNLRDYANVPGLSVDDWLAE
jgi:tRNA(fMet)-specific endonuclease VapC